MCGAWRSASFALALAFLTHGSSDLQTRLAQGPLLLEPVGFAMDRKMLLGIKERVEASAVSPE